MTAPRQAVILCGGLGTRLRPLTDTMPKPLAPVNGRPFLAYVVDQLAEQGIERIVLLTGYRGEMIRDHFGDGSESGVSITYSHGPAEWETGKRVWEARGQLDERFILLYSDNFACVSLDRLAAAHEAQRSAVTLLLHAKRKGNIKIGVDGRVEVYDPDRRAPGLDHVEIGYMTIERDQLLSSFDDPEGSLSRVLERLARRGKVSGVVTGDPYHSISDVDRWHLAERYLTPKRILLIDRDGTINARPPRAEYIYGWSDFRWVDSTVRAMTELAGAGFRFIVLSNQAGIGRSMLDASAVKDVNERMVGELRSRGVEVLDVYVCPHHWEDRCECRKPEPGLFFRAAREHLVRLDRAIYVGDDPRDSRAAFNAGCLSVLVGPERDQDPGGGARPAYTAETLDQATEWIIATYAAWEKRDTRAATTGAAAAPLAAAMTHT